MMTLNCIVCFKPATFWTGHVDKGDGRFYKNRVIAGWCSDECLAKAHKPVKKWPRAGFMGQYDERMGIKVSKRQAMIAEKSKEAL